MKNAWCSRAIFCVFLLSSSQSLQAGWWYDVKKVSKEAINDFFSPESNDQDNSATLSVTSALANDLPQDWQAYFVNDSVFDKNVLVATTGKKGAPWVLLVHGLGQKGMRDWLSVVPALQDNYQILMIDLPGFGSSPAPSAKLTPTRYSKVLHRIQKAFTDKPVFVVGHSMGGAVALRYTSMYTDDVQKLLLVDVAGVLERTAFVKHSALDRIEVKGEYDDALSGLLGGVKDLGGKWVEILIGLPDPTVLLSQSDIAWGAVFGKFPNLNAAIALVEEDFTDAIYALDKDVAILWGEQDKVAPTRTGVLLSNSLSRASIHWLPDAGHVPMNSHTAAFNKWIRAELNSSPLVATQNTKGKVEVSKGDYACKDQSNVYLSGTYEHITIEECTAVYLTNIDAKSVTIKDSVVEAQNLKLSDKSEIKNSTFLVTTGKIENDINLSDARIDFAGVSFADEAVIRVFDESRVIMSISRRGKSQMLHGDFLLENKLL